MAKNKVYIDVVVDDKGTTKKVAISSKALGNQLDGLASSTEKNSKKQKELKENTDKTNKSQRGINKTAASGAKNFANMSSSITGGLVPAYATLAANIFAITAVFEFFSKAADTANLVAGQEALAISTGVAYKTISNSIKDATGAQLSYKEAASAAAIGTASGLSPDQLTRLGKAAADTSLVLGRDLTDSFNRLIRGVTKAEPELLDELGIILRLKPATEKYAASIGKVASELSAFERSQAVANEVLEQAERKFGDVADKADKSGQAINRLKTSFDRLLESLQLTLSGNLAPFFDFLASNTTALIASLGFLGSGILKSLTPAGPKLTTISEAAGTAEKSIRGLAKSGSKLGDKLLKGTALSNDDFKQLERSAKAANSTVINVTKNTEDQVLRSIRTMQTNQQLMLAETSTGFKKWGAQARASISGTYAESGKLFGSIKLLGKGLTGLLRLVPYLGIALLAFEGIRNVVNSMRELTEEQRKTAKAAKDFDEKLKLLNEELESSENVLKIQRISLDDFAVGLGNVVNSADLLKNIDIYQSLKSKDPERAKISLQRLEATIMRLSKIDPEFSKLTKDFREGKELTKEQRKELILLSNKYIEGGQALQRFNDSYQQTQDALGKVAGTSQTTSLSTLVETYGKMTESAAKANVNISTGIRLSNSTAESAEHQLEVAQNILKEEKESLRVQKELFEIKRTNPLRKPLEDAKRAVEIAEQNVAVAEKENKQAQKNQAAQQQRKKELDKQNALIESQRDIFKKANDDIIANQKERLTLEKEISEKKTLGITIDQKRTNLALQEKSDKISLLKAEEDLLAKEAQRLALLQQPFKMSELAALTDAVEAAKERVAILKNTNRLNAESRGIEDEKLDFQKTLNEQKEIELLSTEKLNKLLLKQKQIQAGITPGVFGFRQAKQERNARRDSAIAAASDPGVRNELMAARSNRERLEALEKQNKASRADVLVAKEAEQAAQRKLDLTLLTLDTILNEEQSLHNQVLAESELVRFRREQFSLNPMQDAFNQKVVEYKQRGIHIEQQTLDFLRAQIEEQHAMNEMIELQEGLRSSLQQGMAAGFEGLITGTKSVKQAFSDMATGILKMLAQMISQMLAARILMSIFGLAMPGLSYGGAQAVTLPGGVGDVGSSINTNAGNISAGLFKGPGEYSTGGIARGSQAGYPAILHGTEAVVPLPNGKSIPVEMNNSQATSNNSVVVNVAMGEGTSKQSQGESQGANSSQLGRLIAGAVQRELQEQQRPGGILSPYGAAR
jgi:hypothetical protein